MSSTSDLQHQISDSLQLERAAVREAREHLTQALQALLKIDSLRFHHRQYLPLLSAVTTAERSSLTMLEYPSDQAISPGGAYTANRAQRLQAVRES